MVDEGRSGFSVRGAATDDVEGIVACLRSAFEPYRSLYTREAFQDTVPTPERVLRRLAELVVLVAMDRQGTVVGTVSYHVVGPGEGHVRGMAVLPAWQGRRVAHALMDAVESDLRRLGCTKVTLGTTEHLRRAMRFYEQRGFHRSGRVSDFFGMTLWEYVKPLG